jgi:hypothetical protein
MLHVIMKFIWRNFICYNIQRFKLLIMNTPFTSTLRLRLSPMLTLRRLAAYAFLADAVVCVGLLLLSRSDVFSISKQKKSKHLINKA